MWSTCFSYRHQKRNMTQRDDNQNIPLISSNSRDDYIQRFCKEPFIKLSKQWNILNVLLPTGIKQDEDSKSVAVFTYSFCFYRILTSQVSPSPRLHIQHEGHNFRVHTLSTLVTYKNLDEVCISNFSRLNVNNLVD